MARRGVHGFTLTDVAAEVGLSRAAIILRFKSTHELKVRLMTRMAEQFAQLVGSLPHPPGGDGLLEVAAFIGRHLGNRKSLPSFFATYSANMEERELAAIEKMRGAALRNAILRVMPDTCIGREAAAAAFSAHLTGTIMSWVGEDDPDAVAYLVQKTRDWLRLAGIPFNTSSQPANLRPESKPAPKPARGKAKSTPPAKRKPPARSRKIAK